MAGQMVLFRPDFCQFLPAIFFSGFFFHSSEDIYAKPHFRRNRFVIGYCRVRLLFFFFLFVLSFRWVLFDFIARVIGANKPAINPSPLDFETAIGYTSTAALTVAVTMTSTTIASNDNL